MTPNCYFFAAGKFHNPFHFVRDPQLFLLCCRENPQPIPLCARLLLLQAVAVPAAEPGAQEAGRGLPGAPGAGLQAQVCRDGEGDAHLGHTQECQAGGERGS